METRKLLKKIKALNIPCHLSDNESEPTPLYTESVTFHKFKQLHYKNFQLESSNLMARDISPSLQLVESTSLSKVADVGSLSMVDKITLTTKLGRTIREYLKEDTLSHKMVKRRVKCISMERVTSEDMSLSYRYKASAKQIKKMVGYWNHN